MKPTKKAAWQEPKYVPMLALDVRRMRASLGLTQYQLAKSLYLAGRDPALKIRQWETGKEQITGPAQRALELLASANENGRIHDED